MPVEVMAKRGESDALFRSAQTRWVEIDGKEPFAVVQLRQDDKEGRLFNIVGFQTNLKFAEQRRVFGLDSGAGARGVCALRRDAPKYVSAIAKAAEF